MDFLNFELVVCFRIIINQPLKLNYTADCIKFLKCFGGNVYFASFHFCLDISHKMLLMTVVLKR